MGTDIWGRDWGGNTDVEGCGGVGGGMGIEEGGDIRCLVTGGYAS